jgi:excisionase family DNA binding protein
MNAKELSKIQGLHPETVRDWARDGRLPRVRIGYAIKFDRHQIANWIRHREMAVPVQRYRASKR